MKATMSLPTTRHVLYLLFAMTMLLAACVAPTPAQPTEQAATQATTAPAEEEVEAEVEAEVAEEAAEESEVAEVAGECEEGFRLFDHELLLTDPLCIPANPQRVLPLDIASLEMTLLTGRTPIATAAWMLNEVPLLLPEYADNFELEGLGYPASLEQVALLDPDLILAPEDTIDVQQASEIAPVIVPDPVIYEDWKLGMEFWAAALNESDLYAEMEENYWTRVAELQNALGDAADDEISVVSIAGNGLMLWMPDSAPGKILADVGLERPEAQRLVGDESITEYGAKQWVPISDERIDLVAGDVIFYFTYAAVDPEEADEVSAIVRSYEEKSIWLSLEAVKEGKSYFVPGHWWRAQTYYLANKVIDDLFTYLTDTTATTPVLAIK